MPNFFSKKNNPDNSSKMLILGLFVMILTVPSLVLQSKIALSQASLTIGQFLPPSQGGTFKLDGPISGRTVAAHHHNCAITPAGSVKCWGLNRPSGQLGDGTTVDRLTPVDVVGLTNAVAVSAGFYSSCALISDGTVKCWGDNRYGQLGDGTTTRRLTPVNVVAVNNAIALATGNWHSCALISGGSVKCWGSNASGQLGDGTTTDRLTAVNVTGLSGAVSLAAGGGHTCSLLSNGTVKCWGSNASQQAGVIQSGPPIGPCEGAPNYRCLNPVTVVDWLGNVLSNVVAINAGAAHTCAVISGGAAQCWGDNTYLQLGAGISSVEINRRARPVVDGIGNIVTNIVGVTGGARHSCALFNNNTVKCWGDNDFGQLGTGRSDIGFPESVVGLNTAVAISSGSLHSCALLSDGSAKCWGYNNFGQIGDGTTTSRPTPVTVQNYSYIPPNEAPIVGYAADNVIPNAQISQAIDGTGIVTVSFKIRDAESDSVTLKDFEFSADEGTSFTPVNIVSPALAGGWPDKTGARYSSADTFAVAATHSFTVNTKDADLAALNNVEATNIQFRFKANDGTDDSAFGATENFPLDTLAPRVLALANIQSRPVSGGLVTVTGSFTEPNPDLNYFQAERNNAGWGPLKAGQSDTATPAPEAVEVASTVDGDDVMIKVRIWHLDDFGNDFINLNDDLAPSLATVLPLVPNQPSVAPLNETQTNVVINPNPAEQGIVQYAIQFDTAVGTTYVQAAGTLGPSPVFQTRSQWGGASGITVTGLTAGTQYTVATRARNPNGDQVQSANSASVTYTQPDLTPPDTSITSAVDGDGNEVSNGGVTSSDSITFSFTGSDNVGVTSYECSLDGAAFASCVSPKNYTGLAVDNYNFQVRARDAAGNIDLTAASFDWSIVTNNPPNTPILIRPVSNIDTCTSDSETPLNPFLVWNDFSDPDAEDVTQETFHVQIAVGPAFDFSTPVLDDQSLSSEATSYTVGGGVLELDRTYRWRVRVLDRPEAEGGLWSDFGVTGPAGEVNEFRTPPHDLPIADFTFSPDPPPAQTEIQFDASPSQSFGVSAITYWRWDFDDASAIVEGSDPVLHKKPIHEYAEAGNYTITLRVTDSDNCQDNEVRGQSVQEPLPQFRRIIPR